MEIKACVFDVDHARRELQDHGTPEFPCAGYETIQPARMATSAGTGMRIWNCGTSSRGRWNCACPAAF